MASRIWTTIAGGAVAVTVAGCIATAAQARPMTSTMACAQVQRMVDASGALVLSFTATTYDRVVRDQRYCLPSEVLQPITVPTRDGACFAGYTCREGESWRW